MCGGMVWPEICLEKAHATAAADSPTNGRRSNFFIFSLFAQIHRRTPRLTPKTYLLVGFLLRTVALRSFPGSSHSASVVESENRFMPAFLISSLGTLTRGV